MSKFEKTIIPLISDSIKTIDLTSAAGFIDSFTSDPDKPSGEKELYLMYDAEKRNDFTIDRARRFDKSLCIKRSYIKYVDNKAYLIYSFWIKPDIKKLYNGVLSLNTNQKYRILQFWGPFDSFVDSIMNTLVIATDVKHDMPLSDYSGSMFENTGLTIIKKETVS